LVAFCYAAALAREARDRLRAVLSQLPDRERVIVGLRDIDGHPAEQV
jgi:DNA-directed RNA polymerase specialized sigma24 family protein